MERSETAEAVEFLQIHSRTESVISAGLGNTSHRLTATPWGRNQNQDTYHKIKAATAVEPPNKGHFRTSHFVLCREAVLSSVVKKVLALWKDGHLGAGNVSFIERSFPSCPLFGGSPLSEVPLYGQQKVKVLLPVRASASESLARGGTYLSESQQHQSSWPVPMPE